MSRGFVICPVFSLAVRPFVARNKHDSVVRSRVNICVQIAARLPEGHREEHLLQSSQSCTCSGLIGPQRTEAQFKSRAQVFFFSSGAKLVCPTGLTFDPTPPAVDGVDNQRNLSFFSRADKLGKTKRYAAASGCRPTFLASFYPRMKE